MGQEHNIICDHCGAKRVAQPSVVPQGWVSMRGASPETDIEFAVFCGVGCVVKWIEERQVRSP